MHAAILQFFQLFPNLKHNDFFVAGESYAGKYVPALAYTILNQQSKINLKGISIGNGMSDPIHQLEHSEYLYQIGLIDYNVKKEFEELQESLVSQIKNKNWVRAYYIVLKAGALFHQSTGYDNYFNWLYSGGNSDSPQYWSEFLQQPDVRKAIHVGNTRFHDNDHTVQVFLFRDMFDSVAPWVETLLDNYKVLVYNGQLDLLFPYPQTVNYLSKLNFDSSDLYKNASRHIWYVGDDVAGYVKQAGNLTEVLVRNSGHMVPGDQPKWGYDLISRFTHFKQFH